MRLSPAARRRMRQEAVMAEKSKVFREMGSEPYMGADGREQD